MTSSQLYSSLVHNFKHFLFHDYVCRARADGAVDFSKYICTMYVLV